MRETRQIRKSPVCGPVRRDPSRKPPILTGHVYAVARRWDVPQAEAYAAQLEASKGPKLWPSVDIPIRSAKLPRYA